MTAVDLQHLRQFTAGDRDLGVEILQLFVENAALYLKQIALGGEEKSWRTAAHSLKGSAQGIGAHAVACEAARIEAIKGPDLAPEDLDLGPLTVAFEASEDFIKQHVMSTT